MSNARNLANFKPSTSGQVETADIADGAVTSDKLAAGAAVPSQTGNAGKFLTTDGTNSSWATIPEQPIVSSVSPTSFNGASGTEFTISGFNFASGAVVSFVGNDGTLYAANTTTFVSSTQLTATTPQDLLVANEPYGIKVTLLTGANTTATGLIDAGGAPTWVTASGSLGSVAETASANFTISATDPEGGSVTYSITSGSLPSGLSLNGSTGAITGTAPSVDNDTTSTFTAQAADSVGNSSTRQFSITVLDNVAPTWVTASGSLGTVYDSTRGTATFTVEATDTGGQTITYSLASGSLPTGSSLNSSTGVISGFSAVGSDATSTFTLRATDNLGAFADREFSITVKAPVVTTFVNADAGETFTFSVVAGTTPTVRCWGAGSANNPGLSGGFARATVTTALSTLYIIVGQRGLAGSGAKSQANGLGGAAGGGNGSSGGGFSGVFISNSWGQANSIVIAGGAGGGTGATAANGTNGGDNATGARNINGTSGATDASGMQGGNGGGGGGAGGGGGGGYNGGGGGGGGQESGVGGLGGSNYVGGASGATTSSTTVANGLYTDDPYYNSSYGGPNENGYVVITY